MSTIHSAFQVSRAGQYLQDIDLQPGEYTFSAKVHAECGEYAIAFKTRKNKKIEIDLTSQMLHSTWVEVAKTFYLDEEVKEFSLCSKIAYGTTLVLYPMLEEGNNASTPKPHPDDTDEVVDEISANPPRIEEGTWWVWDAATRAYRNTGDPARGEDGKAPRIEGGKWQVWENGAYRDTGVKAEGKDGKDGKAPKIVGGTWWVWDDTQGEYVDTGDPARGESGEDGKAPKIVGGTWWVWENGEWRDTQVKAEAQDGKDGKDGKAPKIVGGTWWVWENGEWRDTQVKAEAQDGVSISAITTWYALSTSNTTAPSMGWTKTKPAIPQGQFLWQRFEIQRSAGQSSVWTDPVCVTGAGVLSTTTLYALHTSQTSPPTTGWSETPPVPEKGKYLWMKVRTQYEDGRTEETPPVCIALDKKTLDDLAEKTELIDQISKALRGIGDVQEAKLVGGVLLGSVMVLGSKQHVRTIVSGHPEIDAAFMAGISDFGTSAEKFRTALYHDGTAKIGNQYVRSDGSTEYREEGEGINAPAHTRIGGSGSTLHDLLERRNKTFTGTHFSDKSLVYSPYSPSQTAVLSGRIDIDKDGTALTVKTDLSVEVWVQEVQGAQATAYANLALLKDGQPYCNVDGINLVAFYTPPLPAAAGMQFQNETHHQSVTLNINTTIPSVPAGRYTLKLHYAVQGNRVQSSNASANNTSLAGKWEAVTSETCIGKKRCYIVHGDTILYLDKDKLVLRGNSVDIPGVLASGTVGYYGGLQGSYGKAIDANRRQQGRYRINHTIGHTNYFVQLCHVGTDKLIGRIIDKATTYCDVEMQWDGTAYNGAFDFVITGKN